MVQGLSISFKGITQRTLSERQFMASAFYLIPDLDRIVFICRNPFWEIVKGLFLIGIC